MRFSASLNLRPARIGFLVDPRDFRAVRKCLRLCTCLWGGRYNPIIPVFERPPQRWHRDRGRRPSAKDISRGYIRFFEPDVLAEAEAGLATKVGWKKTDRDYEFARVVSLDNLVSAETSGRINFAAGVDISAVHAHLYQKQFQYQLKHQEKIAIVKNVPKGDAFFDAFVGVFPDGDLLSYVEKNYREAFRPDEFIHGPETFLSLVRERHYTPLWFTRQGLEENFSNRSELTFFVFDPSDGQDVIDFWNLCQFESNVLPIHAQWFEKCAPLMHELIIKNFRPIPGNPQNLMFHSTIEFARSMPEQRSRHLLETYMRELPNGSFMVKLWYEPIWENRDDRYVFLPRRVGLSAASSRIDEDISDTDMGVSFTNLTPSFIVDNRGLYGRAAWVNVVHLSRWSAHHELATVYPSNLAEPNFPRLRLGGWLAVSREGWVLPERYKDSQQYLDLQNGRDAFVVWFRNQGVNAVSSDAGRVAEQIIRTVGGLHSCAIFAEENIVKLLDEMTTGRVRRDDAATDGIEESNFPDRAVPVQRWEQMLGTGDTKTKGRMPWITLERFTTSSVLRAGLEIKCPHCTQRNWFDVKSLDYALICSRCLKQFPFPQAASDLRGLRWLYRVIGPFSTPHFARGGYSVALALRTFAHGLSTGDVRTTWTTGLELSLGAQKIELDFALWYQRGRLFGDDDEPILVLGEAKSFAVEAITQRDVDRIKAIASRFPGAFMAIAVLKDNFSKKEKERLAKLARWGRRRRYNGWPMNPLIVLTGTELFASWDIRAAWREKNPKARALMEPAYIDISHLATFSELTQQLYLDSPPFSDDLKNLRRTAKSAPVAGAQILPPSTGVSD